MTNLFKFKFITIHGIRGLNLNRKFKDVLNCLVQNFYRMLVCKVLYLFIYLQTYPE